MKAKAKRKREAANRITVGELRERLLVYSDDTEITIGPAPNGAPVVFSRLKRRGDHLVQLELVEAALLMASDLPLPRH